jgi:mono/diheme cytochrome c family protein/cbb3-type cytochrome oxidase cytochrome c subunit
MKGNYQYLIASLAIVSTLTTQAQTPPIIPGAERLMEKGDGKPSVGVGRVLYRELGCMNCHDQISGHPDTKMGPDLTTVTERISPAYLRKWLLAPHETKPGTTMPDLYEALSEADRDETVEQIFQYLMSRGEKFQPDGSLIVEPEARIRGENLFHSVGCVACHAPRREPMVRVGGDDDFSERVVTYVDVKLPSVPLPDLSMKTNHSSLSSFLLDPHTIRPSGRMPNMKLSPDEAKDIATYLLMDQSQLRPEEIPFQLDVVKARIGEQLFNFIGCARCHTMQSDKVNTYTPRIYPKNDLSAGCLSTNPIARTAWYDLSTHQRESIQLYLSEPDSRDRKDDVESRLASLNCYACHERAGVGGIESGRNPYFSATIEADLGDEGRIPPTLTGIGAKLTEEGLSEVLLGDGTVRLYMATRMPRFGEGNIAHLVDAFLSVDKNSDALPIDVSGLEHHHRNMYGRKLMGTEGFGCVSCHNLYGEKSLGIPAIDLATVPERIQPSWFKEYLLDPAELRPGTRMPAFFEDGKSTITQVFRGNANQQIEALWIYLREIDQTRLPIGMEDNENYELVPKDKPIVLRTFMKEVGTHAIAVGYLEGVHIAFDALNCRLAMAWRGKFMDAESTWSDRFSPEAEPLSDKRFLAAKGMPIGVTPEASGVLGAEAGYRFLGYKLNHEGMPTFIYSIVLKDELISIEELVTVRENGQVVRRFTISGDRKTALYVRPGAVNAVPFEVQPSNRSMTVELNWNLD